MTSPKLSKGEEVPNVEHERGFLSDLINKVKPQSCIPSEETQDAPVYVVSPPPRVYASRIHKFVKLHLPENLKLSSQATNLIAAFVHDTMVKWCQDLAKLTGYRKTLTLQHRDVSFYFQLMHGLTLSDAASCRKTYHPLHHSQCKAFVKQNGTQNCASSAVDGLLAAMTQTLEAKLEEVATCMLPLKKVVVKPKHLGDLFVMIPNE
jgi:hypothetical protein